ncbi:hypothetical protein MPER_08940 [Moniliophthora perniciosa FA553]|nr:hypothetical protein MPER_08940 [Moniliophthora perniciosa FA553]
MKGVRLAVTCALSTLVGVYGQGDPVKCVEKADHSQVLPKKYDTIPLGNVRPSGWLADQISLRMTSTVVLTLDKLNVQMNGLGGHEHEFYAYWKLLNAAVPAAVLAKHDVILNRGQAFLDYVIDHQEPGGWLGPEAGKTNNAQNPRYLWGRYPFMFGAIQMIEYDPSQTDRVVNALHKFVKVANTMLHNGQGMEAWTQTRWADFVMTLEWLYDHHPNGQEALLIDTMKQVKYAGVPWEVVFKTEWHGVNLAEGIKALPAAWRFTHNQSGITWTGQAKDGIFSTSTTVGLQAVFRRMNILQVSRQPEASVSDAIEERSCVPLWSSYLFQIMGDPKYVDKKK